ncbi:MAG: metal ABC transporter ATP-binding protein [Candidatus Hodarchaeota archaeon]
MEKIPYRLQEDESSLPAVEFTNVSLRYRSTLDPAIENITFQTHQGNLVGILGPNGAGKTTLLRGILGLLKPFHGQISILGKPPTSKLRRSIGYVPQRSTVNAEMPIRAIDVVMMGRWPRFRLAWRPKKADESLVKEIISAVGLEGIENRPFGSLSGGQQQRVLVGRALAQTPRLLLLDEPFTGIDVEGRKQIYGLLENLRKSKKITIFVIEQDLNPHLRYDQILLLNQKLIAAGTPAEVFKSDIIQQMDAPYAFSSLLAQRMEP